MLNPPYAVEGAILENAGFVPPELEAHQEIREIKLLLACAEEDGERARPMSRINFLLARSSTRRGNLRVERDYIEKVVTRLSVGRAARTT